MESANSETITTSSISTLVGKKFGARALAFLIDIFISQFLNNIVAIFLGLAIGLIITLAKSLLKQDWVFEVSVSIFTWLQIGILIIFYFGIFEWLYGGTPGKIILKMRVISCDGNTCSFKQAIVRSLYLLVDGFFFGLIAYIIMKPPLYQRLGDKKANTMVVRSNEPIIKNSPKRQNFVWATLLYLFLTFLIRIFFDIGNLHVS